MPDKFKLMVKCPVCKSKWDFYSERITANDSLTVNPISQYQGAVCPNCGNPSCMILPEKEYNNK